MQPKRTLLLKDLSVQSLCSADGHDVDPVDLFRLMLQTRLDAAYQRLDLGTAQAIVPLSWPCRGSSSIRGFIQQDASRGATGAVISVGPGDMLTTRDIP